MIGRKRKIEFNSFFFDATSFIAEASSLSKPKMSDSNAIIALLLASIGIEKILKGILYEINPVYIFPKFSFEDSSEALYNKYFVEQKRSKDLTDLDTITFKNSIQRTKLFSHTVLSHIGLLNKLADTRNIIAHNVCAKIDRKFIRPFLLKKFRPLIREFSDEFKFKKDKFFTALPWEISLYQEEKEEPEINIDEEVKTKLKKHHNIWEQRKIDKTLYQKKEKLVSDLPREIDAIIIPCPACNNRSILYYEPDFDYSDGQSIFTGLFVVELDCPFCELNIRDYDEIDYLRLNDYLLNHFGDKL